jgi:regulator of G-protein signaling
MTNWSEQFHEYDPFLSQSQPSNPWISDDTSLWALNADKFFTFSQLIMLNISFQPMSVWKCQLNGECGVGDLVSLSWSKTLSGARQGRKLIAVKENTFKVLESFLDSEFSSENLRFWMSIQDLKFSSNCQIEAKAQFILDEFLAAGAPCQVSLIWKQRSVLTDLNDFTRSMWTRALSKKHCIA